MGEESKEREEREKLKLEPEGDVEGHVIIPPGAEKPSSGEENEESGADVEAHTLVPPA